MSSLSHPYPRPNHIAPERVWGGQGERAGGGTTHNNTQHAPPGRNGRYAVCCVLATGAVVGAVAAAQRPAQQNVEEPVAHPYSVEVCNSGRNRGERTSRGGNDTRVNTRVTTGKAISTGRGPGPGGTKRSPHSRWELSCAVLRLRPAAG